QIVGCDEFEKASPYILKAGIALQLTNIIRDVAEDLKRGRIYLPEEDFKTCRCNYDKPETWANSYEFKQVIYIQVRRARKLYEEAQMGLKYLSADARFSIAMALDVYEKILDEVLEKNYDVLGERLYVPLKKKLFLIPSTFAK
ncbi:MAG TPA: squalene/phytoene synthase family protein, partial [Vampirovibrionales bacterium]